MSKFMDSSFKLLGKIVGRNFCPPPRGPVDYDIFFCKLILIDNTNASLANIILQNNFRDILFECLFHQLRL